MSAKTPLFLLPGAALRRRPAATPKHASLGPRRDRHRRFYHPVFPHGDGAPGARKGASRFSLAAVSKGGYVALEIMRLAASRVIVGGIVGARLVVIENCGHLSTMERPEAVTSLLRYRLQT